MAPRDGGSGGVAFKASSFAAFTPSAKASSNACADTGIKGAKGAVRFFKAAISLPIHRRSAMAEAWSPKTIVSSNSPPLVVRIVSSSLRLWRGQEGDRDLGVIQHVRVGQGRHVASANRQELAEAHIAIEEDRDRRRYSDGVTMAAVQDRVRDQERAFPRERVALPSRDRFGEPPESEAGPVQLLRVAKVDRPHVREPEQRDPRFEQPVAVDPELREVLREHRISLSSVLDPEPVFSGEAHDLAEGVAVLGRGRRLHTSLGDGHGVEARGHGQRGSAARNLLTGTATAARRQRCRGTARSGQRGGRRGSGPRPLGPERTPRRSPRPPSRG